MLSCLNNCFKCKEECGHKEVSFHTEQMVSWIATIIHNKPRVCNFLRFYSKEINKDRAKVPQIYS